MIIKNYEEDKEIRVFLAFFSGIDTRLLVRDCLLIVTDSDIFVRVMDLKGEMKNEKVIVSEFVTLDGIMKAPERWVFPYWNEEIGKFKFNELFASDALLLGRVTYQIFTDAWLPLTDEENWKRVKEAEGEAGAMPEGNPFAERMNSIPKFVISTSLKELEWNNSRLIKGNIDEEVSKLKQQPGKDILIAGSADLVNMLIKHDFIDEYRLLVYPIVLGSGKRLFKDGSIATLKLVETKTLSSGVVLFRYEPVRKDDEK